MIAMMRSLLDATSEARPRVTYVEPPLLAETGYVDLCMGGHQIKEANSNTSLR